MAPDEWVSRPGVLGSRWGVMGKASGIIATALALVVAGCSSGRENGDLELGRAGREVPRSFVGFSIEYRTLGGFMGLPDKPANPLLGEVWSATGDPLTVRVGGNSADRSWPAGWPRPPKTVRYPVTSGWWRRLGASVRASGTRLAPTVNLAARRPDAAAELLRRAQGALPAGALADVQIGNEPDLYNQARWRLQDGTPTGLRAPGYTFEAFLREQRDVLGALRATGIEFSLTGPGFGSWAWRRRAPAYLAAGFGISEYASHDYPLSNCRQKGAGLRPADLLAASAHSVRSLHDEMTAARAARLPLVVQEGNSVACRGKAGVSDHPYAALWAADELFTLVQAGVSGYRFHASDSRYDPYAFRWTGRRWQVHLAPEYLGILLFRHAAAPGARLLGVDGVPDGAAAWATRDPHGTVRVLMINRSTSEPARMSVPGAHARLLRVTTADGLRAGGRAWPRWQDSARVDLRSLEQPLAGRDGRLTVTLPAASAAVLTVDMV